MEVINLNKTYCLVHEKINGNRNIKFVKTKVMKSIYGISPHILKLDLFQTI